MAYTRTSAPPALLTSWKNFLPGDSGLLSETRLAAFNELLQKLMTATREFNAANTIQIPQYQSGIDGDVNEMTASGTLEYQIDVDPATGEQTKEYVNYLERYYPWTVPTTGELAGLASPQAALAYMVRQINRLNDSITPGRLFGDPRGLVTLEDSNTNNQETLTAAGLPVVSSINADGNVIFDLLEYGVISDLQHNVL